MTPPPQSWQIPADLPKVRLDQWLHRKMDSFSRTEIQSWIKSGRVMVDGEPTVPGTRLQPGMTVSVTPPEKQPACLPQAENLPLEILYEDQHVVAIQKAPGQVVHPAPGHPGGTVLNAMLHRYPDLAAAGPPERPGLVHRLDADTSGVLLFARTTADLDSLQNQFKNRETEKTYLCVCRGIPHPVKQTVNRPIGRHPVHRQKRAVDGVGAKDAVTHFKMLRGLANGEASTLEVTIETGRTHQIRVHLDSVQHPVLGDPMYGGRRTTLPGPWPKAPRLLLHASELTFTHPQNNERITVASPLPTDFTTFVNQLF